MSPYGRLSPEAQGLSRQQLCCRLNSSTRAGARHEHACSGWHADPKVVTQLVHRLGCCLSPAGGGANHEQPSHEALLCMSPSVMAQLEQLGNVATHSRWPSQGSTELVGTGSTEPLETTNRTTQNQTNQPAKGCTRAACWVATARAYMFALPCSGGRHTLGGVGQLG